MSIHAAFWRVGILGLIGSTKPVSSGAEAGITILAYDKDDNVILCLCDTTAHIPSSIAGYAIGCILIDQQNGCLYSNRGSTSTSTFTAASTAP